MTAPLTETTVQPRTPATDTDVVLSVRGLTKAYGDALAVDAIDFDLHRGEFLTLLGESGSGKSTTLMMIAGFESPTVGRIVHNGVDMTRVPSHKRGLGVVFQNYALFPNMTVVDNVAYPLKMRGVQKAKRRELALEALEGVRLTSHADFRISELSGGQQQRVALARALVFKPTILLMDEPLGALDKKLREHLQSELRILHREQGVTVIYVTHDQDEALSLSDRIAVMRNGRIEQIGSPREIYSDPGSQFVADFVGESTLVSGAYTTDGQPHLRLGSGQLLDLDAGAEYEVGESVGLMLRPEAVYFTETPVEGAHLRVRVVDRGYYGRDLRYECAGIDENFASVVRVSQDSPLQPQPGDEAIIAWNPLAVHSFSIEPSRV